MRALSEPGRVAGERQQTIRFLEKKWCPEEDSNLHALQRCYLKAVRLPIPPSGPKFVEVKEGVGGVNVLICVWPSSTTLLEERLLCKWWYEEIDYHGRFRGRKVYFGCRIE
jgi:hypothetical protein